MRQRRRERRALVRWMGGWKNMAARAGGTTAPFAVGWGQERGRDDMAKFALEDEGPRPFAIDIEKATLANENYRATLWTGKTCK